jgi:hypothetical protein
MAYLGMGLPAGEGGEQGEGLGGVVVGALAGREEAVKCA